MGIPPSGSIIDMTQRRITRAPRGTLIASLPCHGAMALGISTASPGRRKLQVLMLHWNKRAIWTLRTKSTVLYMDLSWQEKRAEVGLTVRVRQFASWEQWPSCRDSASDSQVEKLRSLQHFAVQHPLKWVVLCPPTKHQPKNTFHHKSNLDQTSRLMSREQSDEISRVYLLITMELNHFDRYINQFVW